MNGFETITKQFTRFFVPGLAFLAFAVALPATILGSNFIYFGKEAPLDIGGIILLSVLIGYVLDSIRGYRWTLMAATYNRKKDELVRSLATISGQEGSTNPDHYIAVLWKQDEATYNRILVERAEWVMILETSFSLLVGGLVLIVTSIYAFLAGGHVDRIVPAVLVAVMLLIASYLAARNGIDRMIAHDLKLI